MLPAFVLLFVSVGVLAPPSWGSHGARDRGHDPAPPTDHPVDEASDNSSNALTDPDLLRLVSDCAVDRSWLLATASSSIQHLVALRGKAEALQEKHVSLLNEHLALLEDHKVLQSRQAGLARKHSLLNRRQQLSQEALRHLRAKNGRMSSRLNDMASAWHKQRRQTLAAIENFAKEMRALLFTESERLKQSEDRRRLSEGRLEELEKEKKDLMEKVEHLEEQREESSIFYENEVKQCEEEKATMNKESESWRVKLENEKSDLKKELESVREEREENNSFYENEVKKCENEKATKTKESEGWVVKLENEKNNLEEELESLKEQREELENEKSELKEELESLKEEREESNMLYKKEVQKCEEEKEAMKKDTEDKVNTSHERLMEELGNNTKQKEELLALVTQLEHDKDQREDYYSKALQACLEKEKKYADPDDASVAKAGWHYIVLEDEIILHPDEPAAPRA